MERLSTDRTPELEIKLKAIRILPDDLCVFFQSKDSRIPAGRQCLNCRFSRFNLSGTEKWGLCKFKRDNPLQDQPDFSAPEKRRLAQKQSSLSEACQNGSNTLAQVAPLDTCPNWTCAQCKLPLASHTRKDSSPACLCPNGQTTDTVCRHCLFFIGTEEHSACTHPANQK